MALPCPISSAELSRYRDRELPPTQLAAVAEHIDGCGTCQARLADAIALNQLLVEQFRQSELELPVDFVAGVMSNLRPAGLGATEKRPTQRPPQWITALVARRRRVLTFGLIGAAVAASLAIVFVPQLQSHDDRLEEATENEAQIHSIEVSSPDRSAVVFESSEGNTVIWMVPAGEEDAGPAARSKP